MLVYVSLGVMVVGFAVFVGVQSAPDLKEVGRIMFFVGLLVFLLLWPRVLVVH